MGTNPWAEESWDSEPDVAQVPLPVPFLSSYGSGEPYTATVNVPPGNPEVFPISALVFPVDESSWKHWEEEYTFPDPSFFSRQMELMVSATITVGHFECQGKVLIDTGCRIPLFFRKGLIPSECLEQARRLIRISTADGTPMVGGARGCVLRLTLPVAGWEGQTPSSFPCDPYWGYEAAVHSCDLILGYPFLKIFRLVVDCPTDSLRMLPIPKSGFSSITSTSSRFSARPPTPVNFTPSPKPSTLVPHTGVERNSSVVFQKESSPPSVPPGPRTKAADLDVNGKSSSHLVLRLPRRPHGHSVVECPFSPLPALSLYLLLTEEVFPPSVSFPASFPQLQGIIAHSKTLPPPHPSISNVLIVSGRPPSRILSAAVFWVNPT